jgi:hypothetical protein
MGDTARVWKRRVKRGVGLVPANQEPLGPGEQGRVSDRAGT